MIIDVELQDMQVQPNSQLVKLLLSGLFESRPLTCYVQFAKVCAHVTVCSFSVVQIIFTVKLNNAHEISETVSCQDAHVCSPDKKPNTQL